MAKFSKKTKSNKKPVVYWAVVTSNTLHILLTFHLSGQKSHEINENLSKGSAHVKKGT